MNNTQILITTQIPDQGVCYVTVDNLMMDPQEAIKLGEEIAAAGKRALVLNAVLIIDPDSQSKLRELIKLLGRLK